MKRIKFLSKGSTHDISGRQGLQALAGVEGFQVMM
jgi:hypothetical protein